MNKQLLGAAVVFLCVIASPVSANVPLTNPEVPLVIGFADGNMYNPVTGEWKCVFLMDGNCYDTAQKVITTRPANYTPPVTTVPESTPQIVYIFR
jgi:hypothetical protein